MFKHIFTNSVGILVSRIFGFIRDMLTASVLGANIYSDIFFVAFKLPNLFRRIFAEGAFTQTFLPSFTRSIHKGVFVVKILIQFSAILLVLSLFVQLFPTLATQAIAVGFDAHTTKIAAPYVAINFWYLILIFWVTFFTALLHYRNHFATSAFSTALLNLALIGALLLARGKDEATIVYFLSFGVLIGGILQLFVHVIAIKKYRMWQLIFGGFKHYKTKKEAVKASSKTFNKNFLPAMWGNSTAQISAFIDTWLASFLVSGSISYLYYANRVFQLPLALFAIATSVALFPAISKAIKNSDPQKAHSYLFKAFWLLTFVLSAAVIVGSMLSHEIVWLLFERGAFSTADTANTSMILIMYLIGLLPFGLSKLFVLTLYAKQQQNQAAKIATISLASNIVFSLILIVPMQAQGLALASTLSGFIYFYYTIKHTGFDTFAGLFSVRYSFYFVLFVAILSALVLLFKHVVVPLLV